MRPGQRTNRSREEFERLLDEQLNGKDEEEQDEDILWNGEEERYPKLDLQPFETTVTDRVPLVLSSSPPLAVLPAVLNQHLRSYQRDGVRWMYSRYAKNRGGVLGDDMGLGKTVQTVCFLAALLRKTCTKSDLKRSSLPMDLEPVLILAPASLLLQWRRELETWAFFRVAVLQGKGSADIWNSLNQRKIEIVISSYETFVAQLESFHSQLWGVVIFDEVHRLKNPKAKITLACKSLNCTCRFGLTGTPMQNELQELWCVLDSVVPGKVGTKDTFKKNFSDPIKKGQKFDVTLRDVALRDDAVRRLQRLCAKHILRRDKSVISDQLPGKSDHVVFCPLTPLQTAVYKRVLSSPDYEALLKKDEECSCGKKRKQGVCCRMCVRDGVIWRYMHPDNQPCKQCPSCLVLPCMNMLKKISNHLDLIKMDARDPPEKQEKDIAFTKLAFGDDLEQGGGLTRDHSFLHMADVTNCGKMKVLQSLLRVWKRKRSKVLLFSYSTRMLDILQQFIIREGHSYRRLDGTTPPKKRLDVVDEFNNNASLFVLLVSTRAGGLGLNLTSADVVVIFDPNWNPAHDLQAQDRSFRFGQRKYVKVYRLISAGSMEEHMYMRQVYKQQLANVAMYAQKERRYFKGVAGVKGQEGDIFGIANVLRLSEGRSFAQDIIHRRQETETEGLYQIVEDKREPITESTSKSSPEKGQPTSKSTPSAAGAVADVAGKTVETKRQDEIEDSSISINDLLNSVEDEYELAADATEVLYESSQDQEQHQDESLNLNRVDEELIHEPNGLAMEAVGSPSPAPRSGILKKQQTSPAVNSSLFTDDPALVTISHSQVLGDSVNEQRLSDEARRRYRLNDLRSTPGSSTLLGIDSRTPVRKLRPAARILPPSASPFVSSSVFDTKTMSLTSDVAVVKRSEVPQIGIAEVKQVDVTMAEAKKEHNTNSGEKKRKGQQTVNHPSHKKQRFTVEELFTSVVPASVGLENSESSLSEIDQFSPGLSQDAIQDFEDDRVKKQTSKTQVRTAVSEKKNRRSTGARKRTRTVETEDVEQDKKVRFETLAKRLGMSVADFAAAVLAASPRSRKNMLSKQFEKTT